MLETITIYLIIIGQLWLLSYYYPNILMKRVEYILKHYPASTHPKLYPTEEGEGMVQKGVKRYKLITRLTLALGSGLIILASFDGMFIRHEINDAMVTLFAILQFIPFMMMEASEFKHYKLMRAENQTVKRSADLKPRRYFDYISPYKFVLAVFLLVFYIIFNLYRVGFDLSIGSDGFITLFTIILVNIFFSFVVYKILHGKKLDPHLSHKDRDRHIGSVINSTIYASMGASVFLLIYGLLQHYALDRYEAMALSIYFQLCAYFGPGIIFRSNPVEEINFEVYKKDTEAVSK